MFEGKSEDTIVCKLKRARSVGVRSRLKGKGEERDFLERGRMSG